MLFHQWGVLTHHTGYQMSYSIHMPLFTQMPKIYQLLILSLLLSQFSYLVLKTVGTKNSLFSFRNSCFLGDTDVYFYSSCYNRYVRKNYRLMIKEEPVPKEDKNQLNISKSSACFESHLFPRGKTVECPHSTSNHERGHKYI